VSVCDSILAA